MDQKSALVDYLRARRIDLLAQLIGLSETEAHQPMSPAGTSILGLVHYVATLQVSYLGTVFGRIGEAVHGEHPHDAHHFGAGEHAPEGPDRATRAVAGLSTEAVIVHYERAAAQSEAIIETLPLTARGVVPWWQPDQAHVSLQQILLHICTEASRIARCATMFRGRIDEGSTDEDASSAEAC